MKNHIVYSAAIVLGSFGIAVALVLVRHRAPVQNENGEQLKELRSRITQLETKATALERELEQVRKEPARVIYTTANQVGAPPATTVAREQIPAGWKPFEFNGQTYYLTPLRAEAEVSLAPAK